MGKRVFVIVIDALGAGAMPDAAKYGDSLNANTLGNIDASVDTLQLPNMESLGLGHIAPLRHIKPVANPKGSYGKMSELSEGKDTTTGHWEMMGICLKTPFRIYPEGFPEDVIREFINKSGCKGILGNIPSSGTEIIEKHGKEHLETGYPIIYTSADSVFQIAAHVERIPLSALYDWCKVAREILKGEHEVCRVIARPFMGEHGKFERIGADRRDYAVMPPEGNYLNVVKQAGGVVFAVGKIEDIFCRSGITHSVHTRGNSHGLDVVESIIKRDRDFVDAFHIGDKPFSAYDYEKLLVFVNLIDTDMKYGHRRDPEGYAKAMEEIDSRLGDFLKDLMPDDLLILTGDHGCDPTAPGSDHTREYVPVLMFSPSFIMRSRSDKIPCTKGQGYFIQGVNLGTRETFADIGKTVIDWLGVQNSSLSGSSMLENSHYLGAVHK